MRTGQNRIDEVDVICQHSWNGEIIPIRFRLKDEEGELHAYTVKSYRQIAKRGVYVTPDGIQVSNYTIIFECRIVVFGNIKTVRLYYDTRNSKWILSP